MNQLACVYCESADDLKQIVSGEAFNEKANRFRLSVYFPSENKELEEQIRLLNTGPAKYGADFLKLTGIIQAHECIVPFLVKKILSAEPTLDSRPAILAEVQSFWLEDVDVWFNFPETWVDFLKPLTPQAIFDTLRYSGDAS